MECSFGREDSLEPTQRIVSPSLIFLKSLTSVEQLDGRVEGRSASSSFSVMS